MKTFFSLANECSLRNILHGSYAPTHILCPKELQPDSETKRLLSHPAADKMAETLRKKQHSDISGYFKGEQQFKELINFLKDEMTFH